MEERAIAYQEKMAAQYFAANQFKKDYWPADFDGIFIDANYLDVADLVALHKAASALKRQGNQVFAQDLITYRQSQEQEWSVVVRVNARYMEEKRQRNLQICELLQEFYLGDCKSYAVKRQEIMVNGDAQLHEMLRQAEETLDLTPEELAVILDAEDETPSTVIEVEVICEN